MCVCVCVSVIQHEGAFCLLIGLQSAVTNNVGYCIVAFYEILQNCEIFVIFNSIMRLLSLNII